MVASELIEQVREETGQYDTELVQDGYAADLGFYPKGIKILPILNKWNTRLLRLTNYNRCYFRLTLTAETSEYKLPKIIGDVDSCYLEDSNGRYQPLEKTSISELDNRRAAVWRNATPGTPLEWYTIGTKALGLYPAPNSGSPYLWYLATSPIVPMELATDELSGLFDDLDAPILDASGDKESALPEIHHEIVAIGASSEVAARTGQDALSAQLYQKWMEGVEQVNGIVNTRKGSDRPLVSITTGRRGRMNQGQRVSVRIGG